MSTSALVYALGFAFLLGGLIAAAAMVGLPAPWIAVGAAMALGVGAMIGVVQLRRRSHTAIVEK